MTVRELIDELECNYNEDDKIVFSNDNGYTYGYIGAGYIDARRVETYEEEEERENSMDKIAGILTVIAIVIIALIIALIVGARTGILPIGSKSGSTTEAAQEMVLMPDVVGMDAAGARSVLVRQGLIPELTYEESDK